MQRTEEQLQFSLQLETPLGPKAASALLGGPPARRLELKASHFMIFEELP
jgi:hypothetical protein